MAKPSPSLFLLLLLFLAVGNTVAARGHDGSGIAIYWGTFPAEGSLESACATGNYRYIVLSFLDVFGGGRAPEVDLGGHCNASVPGGCTCLTPEIRRCQELGVKVLLSIGGGGGGNYSLSSVEDAELVAGYLWAKYLGGDHHARPFGTAILDGIDFDIESGDGKHWGQLAKGLRRLSRRPRRKERVYLSAAPQCPFPDFWMGEALRTGLFDYVWVQFYNNPPCNFSPENAGNFTAAWEQWSAVEAGKVFLGLPAAPEAAGTGYLSPETVIDDVLPIVRGAHKYGGVMLWSRYYDEMTNFSTLIKHYV